MQPVVDTDFSTKDYVFIKSISYWTIAGGLQQYDSQESGRALGASTDHAENRYWKESMVLFVISEVTVKVVLVVRVASLDGTTESALMKRLRK